MQKLTYTNSKGQSIELGNTKPFLLTLLEGTGGVELDVQTQKAPFQDGATHIQTLLEPRYISIVATIVASSSEIYQLREQISQVFNPKLKGTLKYENGYATRQAEIVIERPPVFNANKGNGWQEVLINLIAPNPFWIGINEYIIKLEDFVSSFSFPFSFPVQFATRGDLATLNNQGDVNTPIEVEFRGLAENPRITNETTGEFIQVNQTILTGQSLFINTEFGRKKVEIAIGNQRLNAFSFIDLDSTFFELIPGENRLSFITDSGNPEVYVRYRHRYIGV